MTHYETDENGRTDVCCLACHRNGDVSEAARLTMTPRYLFYAIDCLECGERIAVDS